MKFKSGLIAATLGISTMLACVGGVSPFGGHSVFAQMPHVQPQMSGLSQTGVVADPNGVSDAILLKARRALVENDLAGTEKYLAEVKAMGLNYQPHEDRPEFVEMLVAKYKQVATLRQTQADSWEHRKGQVELLVLEADGLYRKGDYDYAEKVARVALADFQALGGDATKFGFGTTGSPVALVQRIADKRTQLRAAGQEQFAAQRPAQSTSLAVQNQLKDVEVTLQKAVAAMNAGNDQQAELLCRQVMILNIPESAYPPIMLTPTKVMAQLAAKRQGYPAGTPAGVSSSGIVQASGSPTMNHPVTQAVYNSANDTTHTRQVNGDLPNLPIVMPLPVDLNPSMIPSVNSSTMIPMELPSRPEVMQLATPLNVPNPNHGMVPNGMTPNLLDQINSMDRNASQQFSMEIGQKISNAYQTVKTDPQAAMEIIAQAKSQVESSNVDPVVKAQTLRSLEYTTDQLQKQYDMNKSRIELAQRNEAVMAEIRQNQENRDFVEQRLSALVAESNQLIEEGRYEEAVYVAGKARELAPESPVTTQLVMVTKMLMNKNIYETNRTNKADAFVAAMHDVDKAAVAMSGDSPMMYDTARRQFTSKRQGFGQLLENQRPEMEKEILRKLEMPVTLDFENAIPLGEVLRYISGIAQINVVEDTRSLSEAGVTSEQLVHVSLRGIKLKSALNIILGQQNLTYIVEDEALKITSRIANRGNLVTRHYYVGDLVMPLPNFSTNDNSNSFRNLQNEATRQAGPAVRTTSSGRGSVNMPQSVFNPNDVSMNLNSDQYLGQIGGGSSSPLRFGGANDSGSGSGTSDSSGAQGGAMVDNYPQLISLIEQIVQPLTWGGGVGGGGLGGALGGATNATGTMREYRPTNCLIISQTEDVHAEVAELLAQLRKLNDLQITVEVRYITLADSYFERMGIDFNVNIPNNQFRRNDVNAPSSLLQPDRPNVSNSVVGITEGTMFDQTYDIPIRQGSFGASTPTFGSFSDVGMNMGFAILSDIEAYFFVSASQGNTRSNVLQAPKITLFNGLQGSVSDTVMRPFVTSVIPIVGDFAAAYQPVVVILNEGTTLNVMAVVSQNRQHVKVTLNPTFTKVIDDSKTFRFNGTDESTTEETSRDVGSTDNPSPTDENEQTKTTNTRRTGVTVQQPVIAETSVQTTVSVPDGGTILMGGVKRLSEGRREAGTPVLDKVPFLKRLFSNTGIGRETTSLMLMVTPRIIIQEEEEMHLMGSVANP